MCCVSTKHLDGTRCIVAASLTCCFKWALVGPYQKSSTRWLYCLKSVSFCTLFSCIKKKYGLHLWLWLLEGLKIRCMNEWLHWILILCVYMAHWFRYEKLKKKKVQSGFSAPHSVDKGLHSCKVKFSSNQITIIFTFEGFRMFIMFRSLLLYLRETFGIKIHLHLFFYNPILSVNQEMH